MLAKFEEIKGEIIRRKWNENRNYNGPKEDKRTNNDLQTTAQKTQDWVCVNNLHQWLREEKGWSTKHYTDWTTWTHEKPRLNSGVHEGCAVTAPLALLLLLVDCNDEIHFWFLNGFH
jgi:hypothetical protein